MICFCPPTATSGAHGLAARATSAFVVRVRTKGSSGSSPGIGAGPSGRSSDTTAAATLFCEAAAGLLDAVSSANPAIQFFSSAISASLSESPFGGIFGSPPGAHTLKIRLPAASPAFTTFPFSLPAIAPW